MNPSHTDPAVVVRKALKTDLPAIKALQDDNLIQTLSEQERRQYGFLSFGFSIEELAQFSAELGIMAAFVGNELAGYFISKTLDRAYEYSLLKGMILAMSKWSFGAKPLTEYRCCFLGPICVAKKFRGKKIPDHLILKIKSDLARSHDLGLTFVAEENARSYKVLTRRLKFVDVGRYDAESKRFNIIVLDFKNEPDV